MAEGRSRVSVWYADEESVNAIQHFESTEKIKCFAVLRSAVACLLRYESMVAAGRDSGPGTFVNLATVLDRATQPRGVRRRTKGGAPEDNG
jgi:hypothetical protein